ncbi:MAG: hypothetical protein JRI48_07465 [Deltaproteobacteria bacterium]|nr:hypothetical protein [Deltaproteobacteria bacterium]
MKIFKITGKIKNRVFSLWNYRTIRPLVTCIQNMLLPAHSPCLVEAVWPGEVFLSKYPVNPWSAVEVAVRALPQERFAFCRVSTAGRIALPLSVCNE